MNGIQVKKPSGQQWNRLLDAVVTILKYNKGTIYHAIYIKFFFAGTLYYLKVYNDDIINNNNNKIEFNELTRVFESCYDNTY